MARLVHLALVVAGGTLLLWLVRSIGLAPLANDLRGFGFAFVGAVACELLIDACNTLGWRRVFAAPPVGFWRLYWIRGAGTAVNQLTPTASLGGEAVKAMLLRPRLATTDALASLITAKMSLVLAQAALILAGLAVIPGRLRGAPGLAVGVVLAFAMLLAGVAAFLVLQRRGLFSALAEHGWRLGLHTPLIARLRAGGAALDRRLADFYRQRRRAFADAIGWHFAGQAVGIFQLMFILAWLGTPATFGTCLALEAFALVVDSAVFFVPARIGVQEGGRVLVFTALGLGSATGLAVALIIRLTQLAVAVPGLAAFGYFSLTSAPVAGSISEA